MPFITEISKSLPKHRKSLHEELSKGITLAPIFDVLAIGYT